MARIPQQQEQFISTRVADTTAGMTGQNIAKAGQLALQVGNIFEQRKVAKEMTQVAELSTDFELGLSEDYKVFEQQYANNPSDLPKAWNEHSKEKKRTFLDNSNLSSSQAKASFNNMAENQRGNFGRKAIDYENKQLLINFAQTSENIAEKNNIIAFRAGEDLEVGGLDSIDNRVATNVLAGSSFVPEDQLENMVKVQTQEAYKNWFEGVINTDPSQALDLLESKDFDEKLGLDNLKRLTGLANRNIETINSAKTQADKQFLDISNTVSALSGETIFNPKNREDVKSVDTFWDYLDNEHNETDATAEQRMDDAVMIAEKTGIIPSKVESTTTALLFNGDVGQQAMASQFITNITNDNPRVAEQYDSTTRAFAQAVSLNLDSGVDQKRAVEWARNSIDENKKQEREFRIASYSKNNAKTIQKDIKNMRDDLDKFTPLSKDAEIGDGILSDFATLQQNYFVNENVDRKTAYKLAKNDILSMYGVTDIGTKRYMKYAPEAYYGKQVQDAYGVNPSWIKNQVIETVRKKEDRLFATDEEFKNYIQGISLGVNPDSTIAGGNPSYYIFEKNEFGGDDLLLDENNQPIDYTPNFEETKEYKKIRENVKSAGTVEEVREKVRDLRNQKALEKKMVLSIASGGLFGRN